MLTLIKKVVGVERWDGKIKLAPLDKNPRTGSGITHQLVLVGKKKQLKNFKSLKIGKDHSYLLNPIHKLFDDRLIKIIKYNPNIISHIRPALY